jgi:hypothetical protein
MAMAISQAGTASSFSDVELVNWRAGCIVPLMKRQPVGCNSAGYSRHSATYMPALRLLDY